MPAITCRYAPNGRRGQRQHDHQFRRKRPEPGARRDAGLPLRAERHHPHRRPRRCAGPGPGVLQTRRQLHCQHRVRLGLQCRAGLVGAAGQQLCRGLRSGRIHDHRQGNHDGQAEVLERVGCLRRIRREGADGVYALRSAALPVGQRWAVGGRRIRSPAW